MKRLDTTEGTVCSETEHRLIRWGMTEREATALARHTSLTAQSSDDECMEAVCMTLVRAKVAVDGVAEIEYISGQRRDTLRLEGRSNAASSRLNDTKAERPASPSSKSFSNSRGDKSPIS